MSEYRFFKIPAANRTQEEEELNRFLRGQRVLQVHRDFVAAGADSFWAFSVEYLPTATGDGPTSGQELPVGQPEQEQAREPEQQPGLPARPQSDSQIEKLGTGQGDIPSTVPTNGGKSQSTSRRR